MRERREVEGEWMGLPFTSLCKSSMTFEVMVLVAKGRNNYHGSLSLIGSDLRWIVTLSVVVTGTPCDGHWVI